MSCKKCSRAAVVLATLLIAGATLIPTPGQPTSSGFCLICGARGVADTILNILLFLPLGAALATVGVRRSRVLLLALAMAGGVETLQLVIPGRDPSLGDLLFNTLGALVGYGLAGSARVWLVPPRESARRLEAAAAVVATGIIILTAVLLQPSFPRAAYYAQWAPQFANMEHYEGRVLDARMDSTPLPAGVLRDSDTLRRQLLEGSRISARITTGSPPPGLAPIFSLAAHWGIEVLLIGQDRDALVLRYRPRAADLRLDFPDQRVHAPVELLEADRRATISAQRQHRGWCVAVDDHRWCELGFTVGRGWSLLLYLEPLSEPLKRMLDGLWLAALMLPLGLWARRDRLTFVSVAIVFAALAIVPLVSGLRPTPPIQFLVGTGAVGLGAMAARKLMARTPRASH